MIPVRDSRLDIIGRRRLSSDERPKLAHWGALHELYRTKGLLICRGACRGGKVAKLIDLSARLNLGVALTRYARP
jgi:hypothetical protein